MTDSNQTAQGPPAARSMRIATQSGLNLTVDTRVRAEKIELELRAATSKKCLLHWGVKSTNQSAWRSLPQPEWPEGTNPAGPDAMRTPFTGDNGASRLVITLDSRTAPKLIEFALFFPDEGRWDNNGRRNYQIQVAVDGGAKDSLANVINAQGSGGETLLERTFELEGAGRLAAKVVKESTRYRVFLCSDVPAPLLLHWGIAQRSPHEWLQPSTTFFPAGTVLAGGQTPQTPFEFKDGVNRLEISFPEDQAPLGLQFVLKQGAESRWLKQKSGNFFLPVANASPQPQNLSSAELNEMASRIVEKEMASGSWTLMHRFNLCFELLDSAQGNPEAQALLYVWLRFSAMRQLTWQRNYNTKPRELAHAQDRLTNRLAELYQTVRSNRTLTRLMLATIGRGGDGQRIRDEILQIMHRHHVKEVSGHFLEEWHQKLHNNTTPDDVVICEAYLEFLRANGNLQRFYETLQAGGVTRERLQSFERPIRSDPDFVGHLKEPLIGDFQNFLKILKAVHSSTDLETAINTARDRLDGDLQGLLWDIWNHRNDGGDALAGLAGKITEARRRISHLLESGAQVRPILYLDLALEQLVRVVVERNLHQHLSGDQLVQLIGRVLDNVALSHEDPELAACLRHWERLTSSPPGALLSAGWSLHAKSVVDRIARALSGWSDALYQLLQPKAVFLGTAFHAEPWTINLFSEEVVRGSSLGFALSMLLHQLGRILRQSAQLGDWQIVSQGRGSGQVLTVENLREVQGRPLKQATVVVAEKVMGDEELPKEVVAVLAPDVTDLVSHVAVRARNSGVLFASCSDPAVLEKIKGLQGKFLEVESTAAGEVRFSEIAGIELPSSAPAKSTRSPKLARPRFTQFAITRDLFNDQSVGGKSCSQARLATTVPSWVRQPSSVALPFGCFEHVLADKLNSQTEKAYQEMTGRLSQEFDTKALEQLREAIISMTAPDSLKTALKKTFADAGLSWPADWEPSWRCIKRVWASKWNDRAVLSRKKMDIPDADLSMAVLIQPVIEADYAFVVHTANPSNSNRNELYGEVVLGLGETLVGNFPGRALGFVLNKRDQQVRITSFPSKSIGLYGGGLIFRSDSNGEDLAGFAGAGLYDSILLPSPRRQELDYSNEPLVWDEGFRNDLLTAIGRLSLDIEKTLGSPQDIEGAVAKGEYYVVQARPQVGLDNPAA
jgi:alpha-glucan, water dikinase